VSKPDYSSYTIEELLDCKANIDKDAWPDRYKEILATIAIHVEKPEEKMRHDEIVFAEFCEELREDLSMTLDDNLWPLLKLFSKRARESTPSTFRGEVCPICSKKLVISESFGTWNIGCCACNMEYSIREKRYNP
jgi:hypothetical protein